MKHRLLLLLSAASILAFSGSVAAHGPGYATRSHGGLSGGITIWSGGPHGIGYAGNLYYGHGYPGYALRPAPAHYYAACGHWHPRGYVHAPRHDYRHGYAYGHGKGHGKSHGRSHKHHKRHSGRHH